jgi:hypothetical protein
LRHVRRSCPIKSSFIGFANRPMPPKTAGVCPGTFGHRMFVDVPPHRSRGRLPRKGLHLRVWQPLKAVGVLPWYAIRLEYSSAHLQAGVGSVCSTRHLHVGVGTPPRSIRERLPRKGLLPRVRQPSKTAGVCTVTIFHRIFVGAPPGRSRERLVHKTLPRGSRHTSAQEWGAPVPQYTST